MRQPQGVWMRSKFADVTSAFRSLVQGSSFINDILYSFTHNTYNTASSLPCFVLVFIHRGAKTRWTLSRTSRWWSSGRSFSEQLVCFSPSPPASFTPHKLHASVFLLSLAPDVRHKVFSRHFVQVSKFAICIVPLVMLFYTVDCSRAVSSFNVSGEI